MPSATDVARWMADRVEGQAWVYQGVIVQDIRAEFGDEFVYFNENGNLAIARPVLREFRKLTKDSLVWERGTRAWRPRREGDPEGHRQVD